jgi:CubicO group peptidase (beta-lactamase class C family)
MRYLLLLCILPLPLGEGWGEGLPGVPLDPYVEGLVTAQLAAHRIPGATVAVVKEGQVLLVRGYGEADLESHRPVSGESTVFRIASLTKPFIWVAVLQLAEQGKLDLKADINTYLQGLRIPDTWPQPVTLESLMAHAAGLESPGRLWEDETRFASLEEYLAHRIPARVRPPGELPAYSNWGVALATHVVERVSGMPFDRYVQEHVLGPLEMRRTFHGREVPQALTGDMALGHVYARGVWRAQPPEAVEVAAAGSMGSTAADMAQFMLMLLEGGQLGGQRVLREGSVQRLQQPLWRSDPRVMGWAHGLMEFQVHGHRLVGHTGDAYLFHSLLALQPEHRLGVFVSYNSLGERDGAQQARMELLRAVVGRLLPTRLQTLTPALSQRERGLLTGSYQTTWRSYETVESSLAWMKEIRVLEEGRGVLRVQVPGSAPRRWVEVEPLVFRPAEGPASSDERLVFRQDGRASYLFFENAPTAAYERAPWYDSQRFNLALLAVCCALFLSALAAAPWSRSPGAWVVAGMGLLNLLFLSGAVLALRFPPAQERGAPPALVVAQVLALVGAMLLPVAGVQGVQAWRRRSGTASRRLHLSAVVLAAVVFTVWLYHWRLLG